MPAFPPPPPRCVAESHVAWMPSISLSPPAPTLSLAPHPSPPFPTPLYDYRRTQPSHCLPLVPSQNSLTRTPREPCRDTALFIGTPPKSLQRPRVCGRPAVLPRLPCCLACLAAPLSVVGRVGAAEEIEQTHRPSPRRLPPCPLGAMLLSVSRHGKPSCSRETVYWPQQDPPHAEAQQQELQEQHQQQQQQQQQQHQQHQHQQRQQQQQRSPEQQWHPHGTPLAKRPRMAGSHLHQQQQQQQQQQQDSRLLDLPEELLHTILSKAFAGAATARDVLNTAFVCKRLHLASHHPSVLVSLPVDAVAVPLSLWTPSSSRLLALSCLAGNPHACYHLGMIKFYCQHDLPAGLALLARAAAAQHPDALYSLAVIEFNGSARACRVRNPKGGLFFATRAVANGHPDALFEVGYCLLDGLGTDANQEEGHRLLKAAKAWEATEVEAQEEAEATALEPEEGWAAPACRCTANACPLGNRGRSALRAAGQDHDADAGVLPERRHGTWEGLSSSVVSSHRPGLFGPGGCSSAMDSDASAGRVLRRTSAVKCSGASMELTGAAAPPGSNCALASPVFSPDSDAAGSAVLRRSRSCELPDNSTETKRRLLQTTQGRRFPQSNSCTSAAEAERPTAGVLGHSSAEVGVADIDPDGSMEEAQEQADAALLRSQHDLRKQRNRAMTWPLTEEEQHHLQPESERWEAEEHPLRQHRHQRKGRSCASSSAKTPAHQFLVDWWSVQLDAELARAAHANLWGSEPGTSSSFAQELEQRSLCSNELCGRREIQPKEFRCCASCKEAKYCSRACQSRDWKRGHRIACAMLTALLHEQQQHWLRHHPEQQQREQEQGLQEQERF